MKELILIVSAYYYPDVAANVALVKDLAEYLNSYFDVTVITTQIRGSSRRSKEEKSMNSSNPVLVIRKINPFVHRSGLLSKIFEYLLFIIKIYCYIKNRKNKYSVIFCQSTPPLMSIPIRFAAGRKSKIIYNVQDIFPDSLIPYFGNHKYTFLHRLERVSYNAANSVTTICRQFYRKIRSRSNCIIKVIPNWVDMNEISYVHKERNRIYKEMKGIDWDRKNIVYSGNIGINQDFDTIISVALEYSEYNFIIIGNGKKRSELQKRVKLLGLNNFYIYDPFPKEWISEIYSFGDIYLLPMKKNAMKASYPSKTWSILACGSPLVASVDLDSDFADELMKNELAYVCEPENSKELIKAMNLALCENKGKAAKRIEYIRNNYDKRIILAQFKQIFMEQILQA